MASIKRPNREALQQALDIFRDAMRPFIVRSLKSVPGWQAEDLVLDALNPNQAAQVQHNLRSGGDIQAAIDIGDFPQIINRKWYEAFGRKFANDRSVQNKIWLIKESRDQAAHPGLQDLDTEYTRAHLFHIADVLGLINQPKQRQAVETIRDQLLATNGRAETTEQAESKRATKNGRRAPRTSNNLRPWRQVIRPNPDVSQGTFRQAEFAADLQQVHDGRANATEYGNPVSFFNHTYITPGIRTLLVNALKRLAGTGGDPVIQTKTGFGGGKTHSLIALYHLVNDVGALVNASEEADARRTGAEIRAMMEEAGLSPGGDFRAKVAVLDGTHLSTSDPTVTEETGDPLNTLWGQMAYQLGGQDAYELVGAAARSGTAPGSAQLDELFEYVAPCVVLIDELVAYVRNAATAQDNIYTFVQALTQAARRNDGVALVVTLPESDAEAGGTRGAEALERLERLFGRIEAVWTPLETYEAFEVVRRRLFGEVGNPAERDRTCQAFAAMYSRFRSDYPREVTEQRYLERLKDCYPIHPEIFDRLYADWSSIPQFQRTRGVLRMLATAVSRLYLENDHGPLIMPASLPLGDPALGDEFVKLLSEQWRPVLSEVDSDGSRADSIDKGQQRFADVGGAARRVARTVFLGSAPSGAVRGLDERQIRLGVVLPGQGVSVYNEALNRMSGDLYYFYPANGRYFFHAEENLNKVASDRREKLDEPLVNSYIIGQLNEAVGSRSDVLVCPRDSTDVPEAERVRLVILRPQATRPSRATENDHAEDLALQILKRRGDAGRMHPNTLLFLASKSDEVRDLRNRVKDYLAWESIVSGEVKIENLAGSRRDHAFGSLRSAEQAVRHALVRAYRQALSPVQDNPQRADYRLSAAEINAKDSGDIVNATFQRFVDDEALVDDLSPTALASLLQQYVWDSPSYKDHISVDALWNLLTSHIYMHRLRNGGVLQRAIDAGVMAGRFGYARGYQAGDYRNLRFREPKDDPHSSGVADSGPGLLVSPEVAERAKAEEVPSVDGKTHDGCGSGTETETGSGGKTVDPPIIATPTGPTLIVAAKSMQGDISLDEVNSLREDIIRSLSDEGAMVTIKITITAEKAEGFQSGTARGVRENSGILGVDYSQHPE